MVTSRKERGQSVFTNTSKKIKLALDELHSYECSHNDVRLPNIAFIENYEAELVDLDRCYYPCDEHHPYFDDSKVDMYNGLDNHEPFNGKQTDFFQLRWLVVLWALDMDHNQTYHYRNWDNQREDIRNDPFISSVINKGNLTLNLETSALIHDKVNFITLFSSSLSSSEI